MGDIGGIFSFEVDPEIDTPPTPIVLTIPDGEHRDMTVPETVPAVLHTITETGIPLGFFLYDVVCTDENGDDLPYDHTPGTDFVTVTVPEDVNVVCDFTNAREEANLSLEKSVNDSNPEVGDPIVYTITVTNAGPMDATGVEVEDILPSGVTYFSDTPSQGTYTAGIWDVGTIADGADATLDITVTVNPSGVYENIAQVHKSDQDDPNSAPDNHDPTEDDQDNAIITPDRGEIALVCDNSSCNHPDKDLALVDHLEDDLGYTLVQFADDTQGWNTDLYPLIILSESVLTSKTLWLRNVETPIMTLDDANHDEIFGGHGSGSQSGETKVEITGSHPITSGAGFTNGEIVTVFMNIDKTGFMRNNIGDVDELAHYDGQSSNHFMLAADIGDIPGVPEKRSFIAANFFSTLTTDGKKLFDSTLAWTIAP
jgi:uncharacterized repeat protein (TIGR01451 family)